MKEFPPFRLDVSDQCVWRGDQRLRLTPKAFAVLRYLVDRAGRLVTQNELLEAIWPETFVQPEVLKSQILDIRTALGDSARQPIFIETVQRRGYRFIAPVRDMGPAPAVIGETASKMLVGRGKALDDLRACLARALAGERQIVFVTGEQGIGKTTLLERFVQEIATRNVHVARGQCLEEYGAVKEPYGPVLEAITHLARIGGREVVTQVLETHAPTWLIQLPGLMTREHRETLQRELIGATRDRMIREICEALEILTERTPLILLMEDLHWSDHPTIDLIAALAYRKASARLLVIGTFRPVDLVVSRHPLRQASQTLKTRRLASEITLTPFGEADIAQYLAVQAGDDKAAEHEPMQRLARWVAKQTDGNPLFIVAVIEHLMQLGHIELDGSSWTVNASLDEMEVSVPDTLRHIIELQIEQLSPGEQLTLEAASVCGFAFSAAVASTVLDIRLEDVEDICNKLARQEHFIRIGSVEQLADDAVSQRYEFVHGAFRSVLYHRLAPARRVKLHRRFGEAIESVHRGDRSAVAAELAGHFRRCAEWPRTVDYLLLAAQNAWRRFAYRDAHATLELALEAASKLPESHRTQAEVSVLEKLAILEQVLRDMERLIPTLDTLITKSAAGGITDTEIRALCMLASVWSSEDGREIIPLLDRVQALSLKQTDSIAQAQTRAIHAVIRSSTFGWEAQVVEEHAASLEEIRRGGNSLDIASHLMDGSYMQWARSRYAESIQSARESLPVLLESGRLVRYLQGRDLLAVSLAFLGRFGEALDTLDESIEAAMRNDAPARAVMPKIFKAWVHLQVLDYGNALALCEQALPSLAGRFLKDRRWLAMNLAASATAGLGYHDEALRQLLQLRREMSECPVVFTWYWRMPLQLQIAEAYLAQGDMRQARAEADRAIEVTTCTEERTWQSLAYEASGRVARIEGDRHREAAHIKTALDVIEGFDVALAAWRVYRSAAEMYRSDGNTELWQHYRDLARAFVANLANSLESRPALQQTFLAGANLKAAATT